MPQNQNFLNSANPVVESDGTLHQSTRPWMILVSNNVPIVNEGSPEGVVLAAQYSLYIDETDPDNPVQYRKMRPEVGGDRSKGWIAV